jgi:hypothetical protein
VFHFTEHLFFVTELFDFNEAALLVLNFNKKGPPVMKLFRYTPLLVVIPTSVAKSDLYPRCLCLTLCPSITQSVRLSVSMEQRERRWKNFRKILFETFTKILGTFQFWLSGIENKTFFMKNYLRSYDWPV